MLDWELLLDNSWLDTLWFYLTDGKLTQFSASVYGLWAHWIKKGNSTETPVKQSILSFQKIKSSHAKHGCSARGLGQKTFSPHLGDNDRAPGSREVGRHISLANNVEIWWCETQGCCSVIQQQVNILELLSSLPMSFSRSPLSGHGLYVALCTLYFFHLTFTFTWCLIFYTSFLHFLPNSASLQDFKLL